MAVFGPPYSLVIRIVVLTYIVLFRSDRCIVITDILLTIEAYRTMWSIKQREYSQKKNQTKTMHRHSTNSATEYKAFERFFLKELLCGHLKEVGKWSKAIQL